ncbi:DUF1963 domain-containing protein [Marinitenerispora sediminis]|uniref:DUF1963 domain-containing protein n=1 Tax=Marinitenerispora sediminis TaxID=1931232 RepID=A0A368SZL0_9ACTN|nr:DUF1963 domain-containing protein [Marinitenerispora sediminis]RCV48074.1 DUF1963 domain-containing protein [Marinitenerispora sediminis]RCV51431.1 DUF1963 domain-containing protein [Marinitenerispora sediminis]RCV57698.1 DUF1963 domain-containing protein [Marinitenerispora sediminis]
MEFATSEDLHRVCAERLGETAGRRFAALARRGFRLEPAGAGSEPTGRCRTGGPALLEPGTPWPELDGFPLSLHAVLDTDALAPWLGDELPCRPGLLNFFYLDPALPYERFRHLDGFSPEACRVVPADPDRAVVRPAPSTARSYPPELVHAAAVAMLPDSWDVEDDDLPYDDGEHWGATSFVLDRFGDLDGNSSGNHQAFGWPGLSHASGVSAAEYRGERRVHLLQLAEDGNWSWGDAGTLYFLISEEALAKGDFSQVVAEMRCC